MISVIEEVQRRLAEADKYARWARAATAEARRLQEAEKTAAISDALDLYAGKPYRRAKALADDLSSYAGRGWIRERGLTVLPASAPPKRRAWHRILRSRDGQPLACRRLQDFCNPPSATLPITPCESLRED